jgi:hypothetical protein
MVLKLALAKSNLADTGSYYQTVFALTPKQTQVDTQIQNQAGQAGTTMPSANPWLIYTPFIIFFCLFIAAFGILTVNRIWNLKRTIASFVVALFFASIPYVMNVVQNGIGSETKAGPDEIPRNVRIIQQTDKSLLIMWDTDTPQIGGIKYSIQSLNSKTASVVIEGNGSQTQNHAITLDNLSHETYIFEIYSGHQWYDLNGQSLEFTLVWK